ncbi:GtrA family protein, partial [Lachnoanaerobaculum sp.]
MKDLLIKYKSVIMYMIFGILTTVVNIVTYYICAHIINMNTMVSTGTAWVISVLFAYITNRKYVFESDNVGLNA